jgi:signal transduction histidine kinase
VSRLPLLRTRLALLHAGVAFCWGVLVVAFVDVPLFAGSHTINGSSTSSTSSTSSASNLPALLRYSGFALVVIAGLSVVVGWVVAGRSLRPLLVITSAARTMSADTLAGRVRVPVAYREFAELADTLDGLRRRLDESFTAQRQFVANASHELRTPLTVQRTLLQVTLADPAATAETLRSACVSLVELGQQQEHLISALLTLAGGYQPPSVKERFDLAELVRDVVVGHPGRAGVRVDTALSPTVVTGDPRLAASLVGNLVDNALRHNIHNGTVWIATTPPGCLTVSNTGAVIPPAEIARLFQPFQRLGTDRTDQTEGHGLGLAIVAAIADAHHADLAASPRPGGGLDITLSGFGTV